MNPGSPDSCLVYLVRHGATDHNLLDPPRMQGRNVDQPLAEVGRRQAAAAARALADRPIAAVYTSPLRRATETASAIAAAHQLQPQSVESLVEVNVGHWEDRAWSEIAAIDHAAYQAFREDPVSHGYPGGENLAQLCARVTEALRQLAGDHLGQQIVVVAHSVVNRVYLGELLGVPMALRRLIPQDNCGISLVTCRGQRHRATTINAREHLRG